MSPVRRIRGSTAEWYAGYAVLFLILFVVALTVLDYEAALIALAVTVATAGMAVYRWKRPEEDEE